MPIQNIRCNPAMSIARVGSSSRPMDSFAWVASDDPHIIGETAIKPEWTLDIEGDGTLTLRKPDRIDLKDNGRLRPVAPFIEVWCDVGDDGDEANWRRSPLTPSLLSDHQLEPKDLTFAIRAVNMKVARRTGRPAHRYGTREPVILQGNQHERTPLVGRSPEDAGSFALIPEDRPIPLGQVQLARPRAQSSPNDSLVGEPAVNLETIRLRVTPGKGEFYGPPGAANPVEPSEISRGFSAVNPGNDSLDLDAGWLGARALGGPVQPGDTYDGAEAGERRSLGIIDDTCEILVEVQLDQSSISRPNLDARANVFCGPPDYGLDRRPFVSLADSLNDRAGDKGARNSAMSDEELDRWVEDLFERVFETAAHMNVDLWRTQSAAQLPPEKRRDNPIPDDGTPGPDFAMGGLDELRDGDIPIPAPSGNVQLPLSARARERHRNLSDIIFLKRFVRENPGRLNALIRLPFFRDTEEIVPPDVRQLFRSNMQMPPFMRNSNAQPLTLTEWQRDLLLEWEQRVLAGPVTIEEEGGMPETLSAESTERRQRVLQQIRRMRELGERL